MRHAQGKRSLRGMALLLLLAAVMLLALAAPALAAPAPTTLEPTSPALLTFNYGGGTMVSARLMSGGLAIGGQLVRIEQSTTGTSPWALLYIVTAGSAPYYADDTYSGAVLPRQTMYYRFAFEGNETYGPSTSSVLTVRIKPIVGKPVCPQKVRRGKRFTVSGTLNPAFAAGSKTVTIRAYRLRGSKWVSYKGYAATNSNLASGLSKYSARIKITKAGKYRFKATTATTASFAAAYSVYSRTLTIR